MTAKEIIIIHFPKNTGEGRFLKNVLLLFPIFIGMYKYIPIVFEDLVLNIISTIG